MILLDTNVVSELLRPSADPSVEAWVSAQNADALFLSAVSAAELRYGVAILPEGQRKEALEALVDAVLDKDFAGRILPFDSRAARDYAAIAAARREMGRPISQFDCQIAAIARANALSVATRNVRDFQGCGIEVVDPWGQG
jgi:predicted nucleic acid-binding protein